MAVWIWKFGAFEIYHSALVHNRRTQYGYPEPPVWKVYSPDSAVRFSKTFRTEGGSFRVTARGDYTVNVSGGASDRWKYGRCGEITLPAGEYRVDITVSNMRSFPCLYVEGILNSDESWLADDFACEPEPVGCYARFSDPGSTPEVFPFSYEPISCVSRKSADGGTLFDFGKETFARTRFTFGSDGDYRFRFGESEAEAMSADWCVIRHQLTSVNRQVSFDAQAFRYIYVSAEDVDIEAEYEYLPLEYRGAFRCDDPVINRVWDVAAYTFHLNTREFFLDGIKRDRWVWAADAYQSLFVNRFLFMDAENEKRTLIALGGRQPVGAYINTIMDYSYFWLISLMDYYTAYGDVKFIEQIWPQAAATMEFCLGRVSEDGFIRGQARDWVFIDWAPMDKTGALCGEQILLAKAMESFAAMCRLLGKPDHGLTERAKALQAKIIEYFYDPDARVFVDSYESGKHFVTRQSNLLAYLFMSLDEGMKRDLYENIVLNDAVPQITTPYFKFYENQVICEAGDEKRLEKCIREYYGSMLDLGATTLYEEYDPTKTGEEHFAMYGHPFEKSLCHAWSASPIYLLGRYRAGVRFTADSFEVRPCLGDMKHFRCTVPLPRGSVTVEMDEKQLTVETDVPNGTLIFGGKTLPIIPGEVILLNY